MPDDSPLSAAIREAYATAQTNLVYLDTLSISNPAVETLYLVRDRKDYDLTLEDGTTHHFIATGFRFTLPAAGDNGVQDLNLAIDNIDRRPSDFIKAVLSNNDPVQVVFRPYISSDLTKPQMNPPLILFLRDIQINAVEISGRATFADVLNRKFLSELYTRRRFPAL
jgi:Domain of unknown function (DUF1833)